MALSGIRSLLGDAKRAAKRALGKTADPPQRISNIYPAPPIDERWRSVLAQRSGDYSADVELHVAVTSSRRDDLEAICGALEQVNTRAATPLTLVIVHDEGIDGAQLREHHPEWTFVGAPLGAIWAHAAATALARPGSPRSIHLIVSAETAHDIAQHQDSIQVALAEASGARTVVGALCQSGSSRQHTLPTLDALAAVRSRTDRSATGPLPVLSTRGFLAVSGELAQLAAYERISDAELATADSAALLDAVIGSTCADAQLPVVAADHESTDGSFLVSPAHALLLGQSVDTIATPETTGLAGCAVMSFRVDPLNPASLLDLRDFRSPFALEFDPPRRFSWEHGPTPGAESDFDDAEAWYPLLLQYAEILRADQYFTIQGRRLVVVGSLARLDDPRALIAGWRGDARTVGLGELHIAVLDDGSARSHRAPEDVGADSVIRIPSPRNFSSRHDLAGLRMIDGYVGLAQDYAEFAGASARSALAQAHENVIASAIAHHDDSRDSGDHAEMLTGFSPAVLSGWLRTLDLAASGSSPEIRLVGIAGWHPQMPHAAAVAEVLHARAQRATP